MPPLTHGLSRHPLYSVWAQMIARCENPQNREYHGYGGRGIAVCDEWHDVTAFIAWIETSIGPRPDGTTGTKRRMPVYTLDRIDNGGNYEPGNVRWATRSEQMANARRRPVTKPKNKGGRRGMPMRYFVEPGLRFGRLTVVAEMPHTKPRKIACICECGEPKIIDIYSLVDGRTRSCGCLRRELVSAKNRTSDTSRETVARYNRTPEAEPAE